jgi:hypothetical protein
MSDEIEAEIVEDEFKAPVLKDIKYPVNKNDLEALLQEYKEIPTINPDADSDIVAEQFEFVLTGHKKFVKARTTIEKIRKDLKEPSLAYGKKVDSIAKEFQAKINGVEQLLFIQRKVVEDNEARKQREAEEAEELRLETIKRLMTELQMLPLKYTYSSSSDIQNALDNMVFPELEAFEEFLDAVVTIHNESSLQLRRMYDDKILVENAQKIQDEKDAEAKKLKDDEDAKFWAEKDAFNKEQDEFKKKQDEFADKQKAIQEAADLKKAEEEADELMKKQEAEKVNRDKAEREWNQERYNETCDDLEKLGVENYTDVATALFDNMVRNVKWSPDEQ